VLIFGSGAVGAAASGVGYARISSSWVPSLLFALVLTPWLVGIALRISVELGGHFNRRLTKRDDNHRAALQPLLVLLAADVLSAGGRLIPWFVGLAVILTLIGLTSASQSRRPTRTQGESYRIIFIHVPAAWMSMFL